MTKGFGDWERRLQKGCTDAASAALDGNDFFFYKGMGRQLRCQSPAQTNEAGKRHAARRTYHRGLCLRPPTLIRSHRGSPTAR